MRNLKQIWAYSSDQEVNCVSMLGVIEVEGCDSLVSLFPTNPIRLVNHLEYLKVSKCGSIKVIFNIEVKSCGDEVVRLSNGSLKSIEVSDLKELEEVWRIKCDKKKSSSICSFDGIKNISIEKCQRFRKIFTSTNVKFDIQALKDLTIIDCGERGRNMELVEHRQHEETKVLSGKEKDENISTVAIPSSLMHCFHNLDAIRLHNYGVEVVFDIESGVSSTDLVTTTNNQQPLLLLPHLQTLDLERMKSMSHVWKCSNWNKFFILHKQYTQSSFQSLTAIYLEYCERIKYLFSPLMAKLLSSLKTIEIRECDSMEEIVSSIDDKDEATATAYETTTLFPHLQSLCLFYMKNLKRIGGGVVVRNENKFSQVNIVPWSLCQYPREINIDSCSELSGVIPSYAVGQMQNLQMLRVVECDKLVEVFETQGISNNSGLSSSADIDEVRVGTDTTTLALPRRENINVPRLSNLKKLEIYSCLVLQHVFTFSTLESLKQLEELMVWNCKAMEVIVKKENEEQRNVVELPHLKYIKLKGLQNLKGFFLGMNDFKWPLLETFNIYDCPQMVLFTGGKSIAPKLQYIHTDFGKHILDESGLNIDWNTDLQQTQVPSVESTTLCSLLLKRYPARYLCNLTELVPHPYVLWYDISSKSLISSNDVPQLQKLETILVEYCEFPKVVFEVEAKEGANRESQTIVEIPNLRQLDLRHLGSLEYIWKRNHHNRTVLLFPNLTTMFIHWCRHINYVITSSMIGSLQQLQQLDVSCCKQMKEVVKVEEENFDCDGKPKEIALPCLKSLKLNELDTLEGFYLGMENFSLPSLHTLEIIKCSKIKVFSKGHVATPALQFFDTSFGRCYVREDINSSMEAIVKMQDEENKWQSYKETTRDESTSDD